MATSGSSFSISTSNTNPVPNPNLDETRSKMVDLYNEIGQVYQRLVNSGRNAEAAQLRDATERLTRSGSEIGLSGFARSQAIKEIQDNMRIAGSQVESENEARKIGQQLQTLQALAGLDEAAFNQQMNSFKMSETQSKTPVVSPYKTVRSTSRSPAISQIATSRVAPVSPVATDPNRFNRMYDMAAQFRNANAIDKFQREQSMQYSPLGVRSASPFTPGTVGNYAQAQRDMGVMPGVFKTQAPAYAMQGSGTSPLTPSPATSFTAPGKPAEQKVRSSGMIAFSPSTVLAKKSPFTTNIRR